MKIRNLLFALLILFDFGCNSTDTKKELKTPKYISEETLSLLSNAFVDSDYSNGLVITFINGDCSYCTNRIPEHISFAEKTKMQDLNFILLIYSENNFYLKDTSSLRNLYKYLPLVFDPHNLFQIKNKLPQKPEEYSIYIDEHRTITGIGTPSDIYNKYGDY